MSNGVADAVKRGEKDSDEESLICLSSVTSKYGIPKKVLEKFLPVPFRECPNPHYRSASPMKLYRVSDIERLIGESEEVRSAIEKHGRLSKLSEKSVSTKLEKMRETIREAIGMIRVNFVENVEELAIEHYNDFQDFKAFNYRNYEAEYITKSKKKLDRGFLDRITVNYIRHEQTDYDENLFETRGKVGTHDFYRDYKIALMDKIAETYPKYRNECERQKGSIQ